MANKNISDLINQIKKSRLRVSQDTVEEKFEEKMAEIDIREKEKLAQSKAASLGFSYINLKGFPITPEAMVLIPEEQARNLKVVCFLKKDNQIRIGAVEPEDSQIQELVSKLGKEHQAKVEIYVVSEHSLKTALDLYQRIPKVKKVVRGVEIKEADLEKFKKEMTFLKDLDTKIKKISLTEVFTMILATAIQTRASDIHIETEEEEVKVRFRIDGVLKVVASLPKESWPKVISRIKLLAGLKINIEDIPQDGRITIFLTGEKIDVRISTLPSAFGESVVMRLLMSSATGLDFKALGLRGRAFKQLKKEVGRPNGMVITTGPTGSGKTTTLYAILTKLNSPETKIITLEDPIEYKLEGITQSQVERPRGEEEGKSSLKPTKETYSFARGLRAILRQDPDIIMVGEIRDLETAEVAIQAALTGHLVLSTIHTNDASGAIPRFLSMGVKPFLLAPALNAILAQRLVRKICPKCKTEDKLDSDTLKRVKETLSDLPKDPEYKIDWNNLKFCKGKGCPECNETGFKGRIGVFEVLTITSEIEKVILSGKVSEYQMQEIAKKNGMVTMAQDGILKALDEITSVEEVFRVSE